MTPFARAPIDDLPQSDDLDQIITAPTADAARAARVQAADEAQVGFIEKCPKCRGTGRFVGYSGRQLGQCFACKGKGQNTYRTSTEQRASNRAGAAQRKIRKGQEALERFKTEQPAIWAWLDGNDFAFAVSMREAIEKYHSLTENQTMACLRLIAKRDAARQASLQRVQEAQQVDTTKVEQAFASASQTLRSPKLRLAGLTISRAKPESKNPGALYVKADGEYAGKIMGGKLICVRETTPETEARIVAVLNDPQGAAIAYGRMTGQCSCCGRPLSNKESVDRGIGPVCAEKFGW